MTSLLTLKGVTKRVGDDFSLFDMNVLISTGENLAIVGETGSGKSTLLKLIAGLMQPDTGEVYIEGERVRGPEEQLVAGHPKIAYLSQAFELPKFLRVEQVLEYASKLHSADAEKIFITCQIDHLLKRKTDQLSGGERQRIALARLLVGSPRLLLLDEPYAHLDQAHKSTLRRVIAAVRSELGITCMLVTHDPTDSLPWADRVIVLCEGRVVQEGTPSAVYEQSANEYVAGLFGRFNSPSPRLANLLDLEFGWKGRFIRPEKLVISGDSVGLECRVEQVAYQGAYWETEVVLQGERLTGWSDRPLTVGEPARLRIRM